MKILLIVFLAISGIIAVRQRRSEGGVPISIEYAPFIMSIRRDTQHICGGALISPKHVLTAAHCVLNEQQLPVSGLMVVGDSDDRFAPGIPHQIGYIIYPPTFNQRTQLHDVAVLLLSESNEMTNRQILEASPEEPKYEVMATYWAYSHRRDLFGDYRFHEINFLVYPIKKCSVNVVDGYLFGGDIFCGGSTGGETLENTDLGGPLVQNGQVIGIASWINERNKEPYFGYVYKVSKFIDEAKKCFDSSCASPTCAVHPYIEQSLFDED